MLEDNYQCTRVQNTTSGVAIKCGKIIRVIVMTAVASGTIQLWDSGSASGSQLGTITYPSTLYDIPDNVELGISLVSGYFFVKPSSATFDILVVWR